MCADIYACGGGGGGSPTTYDGRIVDGRVLGIMQRADGAVLIWGEFVHCGAAGAVSRPNIALLNSDLTLSLVGWKAAPIHNQANHPSNSANGLPLDCVQGACFDPAGNVLILSTALLRVDTDEGLTQMALLASNGSFIAGSFLGGWNPPYSTFPYHFSESGTPTFANLFGCGMSKPVITNRAKTGGTATLTFAAQHGFIASPVAQQVSIAGVGGSNYNGTFTLTAVTTSSPFTISYAITDMSTEATTADTGGIVTGIGGPFVIGGLFDTFGSTSGLFGLILVDANGGYVQTWAAGGIAAVLDIGATQKGAFAVSGGTKVHLGTYQSISLLDVTGLYTNFATAAPAMAVQGTSLILAGGITRKNPITSEFQSGVVRIETVNTAGVSTADTFGAFNSTFADGGFNVNYGSPVTDVPYCVAVDTSDRVYIGSVTGLGTYDGVACNTYLLRLLSDGSAVDSAWTTDTNGPVWNICVLASGNILVGGDFTTVTTPAGTFTKNYLVELDSTGAIVP
jgi:hypothetical protein